LILFLEIKKYLQLEMNLGHIPLDHIPIRRGKDRKRYYQFQFEIHATYFSAHCKYTLGTGEKLRICQSQLCLGAPASALSLIVENRWQIPIRYMQPMRHSRRDSVFFTT